MSRTVHPGATGVDASFARPPGPRLVELGYQFLVGYISVPPASPKKNLTPAECAEYLKFVFLLLVWEMTAVRASQGAAYGTLDGANAKQLAIAREMPFDVPILVADDTNTTAVNVTAQEAYMRAFAAACAPYPIGIYGDVDILYRCQDLWVLGWLPNAWSWSGGSRAIAEATARALGAHVLQHTGYYIDGTWAVDPDEVIAPFQAWGLGTDPQPQETDMTLSIDDIYRDAETGNDKFALMFDGTLRPLSAVELTSRGIPVTAALGKPLDKTARDTLGAYAPPAVTPIDYDKLAAAVAAKIPPVVVPPYLTKVTLSGTLA